MMNQQAYVDGWKAGHADRVMGGEPNRYSWHGTLDQHGRLHYSMGYRAGWTAKGRRHE